MDTLGRLQHLCRQDRNAAVKLLRRQDDRDVLLNSAFRQYGPSDLVLLIVAVQELEDVELLVEFVHVASQRLKSSDGLFGRADVLQRFVDMLLIENEAVAICFLSAENDRQNLR